MYTIVLGCLDAILTQGVSAVLGDDRAVRVLAQDIGSRQLEGAIAKWSPAVLIVGENTEFEVLSRVKARHPSLGLVVVSDNPALLYGTLLIAAGISCLARSASAEKVRDVIRKAAADAPTFFDGNGMHFQPLTAISELTPREAEVMSRLQRGMTAKSIAVELAISANTVRVHSASIKRKLGVKSLRGLIGTPVPVGRVDDSISEPAPGCH
jgi:two-component system, NarL family, nitrate/nitrite response regulator NarP